MVASNILSHVLALHTHLSFLAKLADTQLMAWLFLLPRCVQEMLKGIIFKFLWAQFALQLFLKLCFCNLFYFWLMLGLVCFEGFLSFFFCNQAKFLMKDIEDIETMPMRRHLRESFILVWCSVNFCSKLWNIYERLPWTVPFFLIYLSSRSSTLICHQELSLSSFFFSETTVLISSLLFSLSNNSQWKEEIGL